MACQLRPDLIDSLPVVVIAEHRVGSEAAREPAQLAQAGGDVLTIPVDVVAAQTHRVGPQAVDRVDHVAHVRERDVGSMVDVGE